MSAPPGAGSSPAYAELLQRLFAARRFGVVLGLERMRALLDRLGAPDRRLGTVVHVGGTNGKGSTVAMIAALATAGGAKVATYTSPHLSTVRERIVIGGELISEAEMVAAAAEVQAAGGDELTFFEQLTAIAFVAIAKAHVDITVLEVGLGGRLDATNVVAAPIAVITGIALDHQAILGPTREDIAREKAGIFKAGQRVVISRSGDPMVRPQLVEAAEGAGAVAITIPDWDAIERVPPLGLEGAHQRRNGAAALAALAYLEELGAVHVEPAAAAQALVHVRHPGRFEWLADDVVADGAHNPDGAAALASLLYHYVETPKAMVVAVSADKDVAAIVDQLAGEPIAFIATRYQQERAMDPEALAELFRAKVPEMRVETAPDLATALARARELAEMVVICGSLFLVGEARTLLLGAPTDPIVVSDPAPTTA